MYAVWLFKEARGCIHPNTYYAGLGNATKMLFVSMCFEMGNLRIGAQLPLSLSGSMTKVTMIDKCLGKVLTSYRQLR